MTNKQTQILELLRLNKIHEAMSVLDIQQLELYGLAMDVVNIRQRELYELAMLLYAAVQHEPVSLKALELPADSLALKGYDVCNELAMAAASTADGAGNADAQMFVGHQYSQGEYGNNGQDIKVAIKWFTLAAQQGHADAQYTLGQSYHYGAGVAVDYEKASEWYLRAIAQGSADAKRHYGILSNDIALGIQEMDDDHIPF